VQHLRPLDVKNNLLLRGDEQLVSTDEVYKIAFDSANDVIIIIDNEGKIIDVNEKLKEVGGYDREELVGNDKGKHR